MNRTLRATMVASVTAAAAAAFFFVPSAAVAADNKLILTSHNSGDVLTPGQTIAGIASVWGEGAEFVLRAWDPRLSGVSCSPSHPEIASGVTGAGGVFSVTMTGTAPDTNVLFVEICSGPLGIGGGLTPQLVLQNPFELSSHGEGGAVDVTAPVVAGKGSPGSTVEARDEDGASLGSAVVGADGTWTLTLEGVVQGPTKITFTQGEKSFESNLVMVDESETTPLVDPVIGGSAAAAVLGLGAVALLRRRARTTV